MQSALFANSATVRRLQQLLAPPGSQDITLTGIPPHVALQRNMQDLTQHVHDLTGQVTSLAEEVKSLRAEVATLRTESGTWTSVQSANQQRNAVAPAAINTALVT